MARGTKKKLAIFAGTSKCLIYAEAKYCASEMPGEIKYYECSRTEYCCAFGCCVSPGSHFQHLWYYWILVIIMFLVCSGGGWWYRYWLQGRYRAAASAIPNRSSNARPQSSVRGSTCQAQRARITYNSARNTVLLHRMWKGPQRNGAAPAYNGSATTSTNYQNMNVVLNDVNCPYYQLYGPPPSYETVIAQSRGKLSNPASPESSSGRPNMQSTNLMPAANIPQCFSYTCNPSTRVTNLEQLRGLEPSPQYQPENGSPRSLDSHEAIPFAQYPQFCAGGVMRQNVCGVPFEYPERSQFVPSESLSRVYQGNSKGYVPYPMDKSSDASDQEIQGYDVPSVERYTMLSIDPAAGSSREENPWEPNDRTMSKVHGKLAEKGASGRTEKNRQQQRQETSCDVMSMFSSITESEENDTSDLRSATSSTNDFERQRELTRNRRVYGGSFKLADRYARTKYEGYTVQRAFSKSVPRSCEEILNSERTLAFENTSRVVSPSERLGSAASMSPFQSNPSNNVILESFVSVGASESRENLESEEPRPRPMNASTNSDLESKHRLDRSKSLD